MRSGWIAFGCLGVGILTLSGCASWPRWSAAEKDAEILSPTEAQAAFDWGQPLPEAEGSNDGVDAPAATLSSGNTVLGEGDLEGIGWCSSDNGPACENEPSEGCAVPFGDALGVYAGDVDTWVLEIEGTGALTLCARAEVLAGSAGGEAVFDMLLVPLSDGCPEAPVPGLGEDPLGWSIGPGAAGWSSPVTSGSVAVLLAGALALEGNVDETFPYRIGFAVVPTAPDGGLTHCPLLPGETLGETE